MVFEPVADIPAILQIGNGNSGPKMCDIQIDNGG